MRGFLIALIVTVILAAVVAYVLWDQAASLPKGSLARKLGEEMRAKPPEPVLRKPLDYHILQDQGGIPLAEAQRAGLVTSAYAYLRGLTPVQQSDGVGPLEAATVRGKRYELGYGFESRPPEKQYLEFNIGGKWHELDFGFGFDDAQPSDPTGKLAIELTVELDGRVAYTSPPLDTNKEPVFTSLDVSGVRRVIFCVRRIGYNNLLAPVLLDPFLKAGGSGTASNGAAGAK
jgi:hypothetical protein